MMGNVFLGVRYPPKPASLSLLKSNISNGKGDGGLFEHGTKDCHVRRKEARCDHRMQRFRCGELELLHAIRARPHRREKATPVLLRINNVTQERATSAISNQANQTACQTSSIHADIRLLAYVFCLRFRSMSVSQNVFSYLLRTFIPRAHWR